VALFLGCSRPTIVASLFDRPSAGVSNPEADDLDRLAASLHRLAHYCLGEPFVHEASQHFQLESMSYQKQMPGSAVRVAGKQL